MVISHVAVVSYFDAPFHFKKLQRFVTFSVQRLKSNKHYKYVHILCCTHQISAFKNLNIQLILFWICFVSYLYQEEIQNFFGFVSKCWKPDPDAREWIQTSGTRSGSWGQDANIRGVWIYMSGSGFRRLGPDPEVEDLRVWILM
jgi:hypothetical protein